MFPKVPGSFIAILVSTVLAVVFFDGKLATIGSEFGSIPNTLPGIQMPQLTFDRIKMLIQPAFIIAALGAIESLLSCVVADGMSGTRHDSNRELIGQGLANMVAPIFGGIPATGALARTATNIKSGAVTALSGIIHSVVVLVVVCCLHLMPSIFPCPVWQLIDAGSLEYEEQRGICAYSERLTPKTE